MPIILAVVGRQNNRYGRFFVGASVWRVCVCKPHSELLGAMPPLKLASKAGRLNSRLDCSSIHGKS